MTKQKLADEHVVTAKVWYGHVAVLVATAWLFCEINFLGVNFLSRRM